MSNLAYWNSWPKPLAILFRILLSLLAGSLLYYLLAFWGGADWVINWEVHPQLQALPTALAPYQHPLGPISTVVDTYVVKQTYWGSLLKVNLWAAHLSLALALIGLSVMLSALTTFTRFWFILGMGAFIALVMLLQLEQLGVAGFYDNRPVMVVFLLILPLCYYLHAFRLNASFSRRLLLIGGTVLLLSLAVGLLAEVEHPVLYVMNYGLPAWLGLTALLLIVVAPEIIVAALRLLSGNTNQSGSNVRHLLVIAGIYLLNLLLYYLEERGTLNLGLYYLGPFWIFPISILLAIWTLRLRALPLASVVQMEPFGLIFYIGLALAGTSTAAYAAATANSPLLESLEDAILYSHLGLGLAFVFYLLINFLGLLSQGRPVHTIMYRPAVMPLFTARLVGFIIMLAFYLLQGSYALFTPLAGINNAIGDIYTAEGNLLLSQQYYRESSQYKFANHRANYALASLAIAEEQPLPATLFLKQTLSRNPTAYAYANLSNLYQQNNLAFDALSSLRQGTRAFPLSAQLYNNLGLRFYQWQALDSALYFLQAAGQDPEVAEVARANTFALLAQSRTALPPDSLLELYQQYNPAARLNLLALQNQQQLSALPLPPLPDSIWQSSSPLNASWVLNYSLAVARADTALANRVQARAREAALSPYEEQWRLAAALLHYKAGNLLPAFTQLTDLADRSVFNAHTYYTLLGQWGLEQEAPLRAAEWFKAARDRGYARAGLYEALALADAGNVNQAKEALFFLPDSLLAEAERRQKQTALLALQEGAAAPDELVPPAVKLRLGHSNYLDAEIRGLLSQLRQSQPVQYQQALQFLMGKALQAHHLEAAKFYASLLAEGPSTSRLRERLALIRASEGETVSASWPWARALQSADTSQTLELLRAKTAADPFQAEALLLQARLLNHQQRADEAYGGIRQALYLNRDSPLLLKAYARQSLRVGLDSYGQETLNELKFRLSAEDFAAFEEEFRNLSDSLNAQNTW